MLRPFDSGNGKFKEHISADEHNWSYSAMFFAIRIYFIRLSEIM